MKKILISFIGLICLSSLLISGVSAADASRLFDGADLLSDAEETDLLAKLDSISEKYSTDVVIVTAESLGEKTPMEYADDYFDAYDFGHGDDGVLLLVSMEERDWWISTSGKCNEYLSESTCENIGEEIVDDLGNENYSAAFSAFVADCDYYINGAINGFPFNYGMSVIISVIVGLIAAFIVGGKLKGELKTVRAQSKAESYVKAGSMNITGSNDFFLYRTVSRTEKPKNDSSNTNTHTSSSGNTHGGAGGKF